MNFCSQEMSGKKEKTLPEAVTLKGQLTKCAGAESTASQGSHFSNLLWKHYIRLLLCWEFSRQGSLFFLQLVESQGQGKHSTSQFYLLSLFRAAPREDKSTTLWVVFVEEKWHQNLEAACLTFHRKRHCDLFMFCGMCRSRSYQRHRVMASEKGKKRISRKVPSPPCDLTVGMWLLKSSRCIRTKGEPPGSTCGDRFGGNHSDGWRWGPGTPVESQH